MYVYFSFFSIQDYSSDSREAATERSNRVVFKYSIFPIWIVNGDSNEERAVVHSFQEVVENVTDINNSFKISLFSNRVVLRWRLMRSR